MQKALSDCMAFFLQQKVSEAYPSILCLALRTRIYFIMTLQSPIPVRYNTTLTRIDSGKETMGEGV